MAADRHHQNAAQGQLIDQEAGDLFAGGGHQDTFEGRLLRPAPAAIAQLGGEAEGDADRIIDATNRIIAPGFVDLHTHYDAQIRWDPWCTISGWHGVTSVVLGNCGFGFAPVRQDFRERSMLTMTRTEAIPYDSMKAGMDWDWETIPEYLDSLDHAKKGVNVIQYMPVASLMTYVMGLEAAKTRPATDAEREEMKRLLHEGMDAGLCGFSIQRLGPDSVQADFDGSPMVTDTMVDADILALAEVLHERGEVILAQRFERLFEFLGGHHLNPNPLDLIERDLIRSPVVELPQTAGIRSISSSVISSSLRS